MPSAEIITIGTEILLGEIIDTNARAIALSLRENGIEVYRKTTIGDNAARIARVIQEALERCQIVITTGGLGPTVDDPTRQAVALAMGVESEFHPELWEQIQARFQRYNRQPTENNRRQAYIPHGAIAIENPVGTAPAFRVNSGDKCIISLPGVPSEMLYLLKNEVIPYLRDYYHVDTVLKTRTLHTAGAGESQIDDLIGSLEELANPTIGLAAHSGQVDVRIVAKADKDTDAVSLIRQVEDQLRDLLGDWIYGADQESLESVALRFVETSGWSLAVVECGTTGELTRRLLSLKNPAFLGGELRSFSPAVESLSALTRRTMDDKGATLGLGLAIHPADEKQEVTIVLISPEGYQEFSRPYGGAPENTSRWAANHSLDLIRKLRKGDS
jgi:competence/damage-inducible protein CinA-like protein